MYNEEIADNVSPQQRGYKQPSNPRYYTQITCDRKTDEAGQLVVLSRRLIWIKLHRLTKVVKYESQGQWHSVAYILFMSLFYFINIYFISNFKFI